MPPPDAAVAHYQSQRRQAEAASILARRQWRKLNAADLDRSWAAIIARLVAIVGYAQLGAARAGAAYVPEILDEDQDVTVQPARFSGAASDGRPLESLLFSSIVRTKEAIGRGVPVDEALSAGGDWLDTLVRTQVADADRGATGVAIAARPRVGYYRMVSPPCCQRCAVLAGRFFKWNAGFQRHPKCDCRHIPANEDAPRGWTSTIEPGQVKDLTRSQRQAISDGADLNKVINAHRAGRRSANGMTTSEGVKRGARRQRITPEGIYRLSSTRDEAIGMLRRYGYLA